MVQMQENHTAFMRGWLCCGQTEHRRGPSRDRQRLMGMSRGREGARSVPQFSRKEQEIEINLFPLEE